MRIDDVIVRMSPQVIRDDLPESSIQSFEVMAHVGEGLALFPVQGLDDPTALDGALLAGDDRDGMTGLGELFGEQGDVALGSAVGGGRRRHPGTGDKEYLHGKIPPGLRSLRVRV